MLDPNQINELSKLLKTNDSVVIWEYIQVLFLKELYEEKIFAFDVNDDALLNFYENIRLNNLENRIQVFEKLVSDHNGKEYFVKEETSEVSHICRSNRQEKGVKLPSISLDKFLKRKSINYVDVIKIGVEGAEMKVLNGLKYYLVNKMIGSIILEININLLDYGSNPKEILVLKKTLDIRVIDLMVWED